MYDNIVGDGDGGDDDDDDDDEMIVMIVLRRMILRMMMLRMMWGRMMPKTGDHTLCEPAPSKCILDISQEPLQAPAFFL